MATFKRFYKEMVVEGDFPVKITLEATNPDEEFVLLQQKSELEGQLKTINDQLTNKI